MSEDFARLDPAPPAPELVPRHVLGTAALVASGVLLCLMFMDVTYGIPFAMPRTWYVNRPLWAFLAIALIPVAWGFLKAPRQPGHRWEATRRGTRFHRIQIYSRPGCHLCEEAEQVLLEYVRYLPVPEQVNIDEDPELRERYHTLVPVVVCDGKIRFKGRVDETLLRRLIEGTPPISAGV